MEAQTFARELTRALTNGRNRRAYDRLVLIAPSQFLGLMRSTLPSELSKRNEITADKDLTWLIENELPRRPRERTA